MKLMAVICEYNPFHNGHAYQLLKQKESLGCDGVICLMSGSFVQRGEPAVCDKWARAEMALSCGCDLVLELPVVYSLQSAEGFAFGAVSLLSKLNFDGYLCFGSETGELSRLSSVADLGFDPDYHALLNRYLETGVSYPVACSKAIEELCPGLSMVLDSPNDTLGIEYLRSLIKCSSRLIPNVIQRDRGAHDALDADGEFLSATGIRNRLFAGESYQDYMLQSASNILNREISIGRAPVFPDELNQLICYAIGRMTVEELSQISGVSGGMEHRIKHAVESCRTFYDIAMHVKTKRYPFTRICRTLVNILLGITKEDEKLSPCYARILGIGHQGGSMIRQLKATSEIPFITKVADAHIADEQGKRLFQLDLAATDLYSLLYPQKNTGKNSMDFSRSPVILD